MNITICPHPLAGRLTAPPSKSYGHRYLLAAFLAGTPTTLRGLGTSADIAATMGVLQALGMRCGAAPDGTAVCRPTLRGANVHCAESGSTLRFLLPVVAALGLPCHFDGAPTLLSRPMGGLVQVLQQHGAIIQGLQPDGTAPDGLTVSGRLQAGTYRVRADVSSQYISGLLFALPMLAGDSRLVLEGPVVSRPYIDITLSVLAHCGVYICPTPDGYTIAGGQTYRTPAVLTVPGDWSGAAFWLAAAAIGGDIAVQGLADRVQGDSAILDYLAAFGAVIHADGDAVCVRRGDLRGTHIDLDATPDLAQIVAVVGAYAHGTTRLGNLSRLRLKESDRLAAIMAMLQVAGVSHRLVGDDLYIEGGHPMGGTFRGGNDHRTVMSCAVLAAYASGNSVVTDAQAVAKSYPLFFQDFCALGGQSHGVV